MKRIVTIQDISCLGKCSLTVALPVISAMGVETSVIPTAMLSVHTAFKKFTFLDLTDEVKSVMQHWKEEEFSFDAIYTGYLGSFEQLKVIEQFVQDFKKPGTLVFMDPVFGDHGKIYAGFDPNFPQAMAKLCSKADIIAPNLTEACLMLGKPYPGEFHEEAYIKSLLQDLCGLGVKRAILTGICFQKDQLGAMSYDSEKDEYFFHFRDRIPVQFHGTGDIFASTCVGALTRGFSLEETLTLAVDFTVECIRATLADPNHHWYGVNFEQVIPMLVQRLEHKKG